MPDPEMGRGTGILCTSSLTDSAPTLDDVSGKDKPWTVHRRESQQIEEHYRGSHFERYAERISECSQLLDFRLVPDSNEGAYKLKLSSTRLCKVRTCQICTWRRSLMYKARAYKSLPKFISDHPNTRYAFLTLTCKNCEVTELRKTITHLNKSFVRLTKRNDWPGIGWIKTVEVTRGRDGVSAHPHLHVLCALEPSYYSRHYLSKKKWIELWKQALKVDYSPILDVQAIKAKDSPLSLLAEIIKYQVKPNDCVLSPKDWFLEYTKQIHGTKAFSIGGLFKDYFREIEKDETDDELIGNDGENEVDEGHLYFNWKRWEQKYRMVN